MDTLIILNFGIIDNVFLILAFYVSYLNIEDYFNNHLNLSFSPFLIGVISSGIANSFSDMLGMLVQLEFYYSFIVFLGCIIGMITIPIMQYLKKNEVK
tara:strand:+ start:204 stop:497 length:294 start_codon:yes stop_codon:yes gene_type:complete